jgi:hypothetical protein
VTAPAWLRCGPGSRAGYAVGSIAVLVALATGFLARPPAQAVSYRRWNFIALDTSRHAGYNSGRGSVSLTRGRECVDVPVAQRIERWPAEPEAGGSNPLGHASVPHCLAGTSPARQFFVPLPTHLRRTARTALSSAGMSLSRMRRGAERGIATTVATCTGARRRSCDIGSDEATERIG